MYLNDILIFVFKSEGHITHICQVLKRFFWGVCYFSGPDQDGPGEGQCGSSVAGSIWHEATATLPGICQILLQIHQELQSDNGTITHSHLSTFQVLVAGWGSFRSLLIRFSSAPILQIPDPCQKFIVEVDVLEVGVGAVLSQRSLEDNQVVLSLRKNSPDERNYDGRSWTAFCGLEEP